MSNKNWPLLPLGEVLTKSNARVSVSVDGEYPNFGIYSFGRGLFAKPPILGSSSSATTLFRAKANQFVYSRLFAFEGAYGIVPPELDGHLVSNEFPLFDCNPQRIDPGYLGWFFRNPAVWPKVAELTTGMGSRRQRIKPEALLGYAIPFPPIDEQRRILARIDGIVSKMTEVQSLSENSEHLSEMLLGAAFHQISAKADRHPLSEVAPLMRRPAEVDPHGEYPQVSVRSFGRGTFHNPPLKGSEITWQKPYLVKQDDILVSNIKAWEGALAVAGPEDDGRFGSHRYLTFVPVEGVITSNFLCFYLLTREGLHHVGEASPGSADRNRTLRAKQMLEIPIPVPRFRDQQRFDALLSQIRTTSEMRTKASIERNALIPSILDRAFKGEL